MTLNAGSLFEPDWDIRSLEIVAWLNTVKPDIVCLQEVYHKPDEDHAAVWVAKLAEAEWYVAFGGDRISVPAAVSGSQFGSAVLSRWPINGHSYHPLPTMDKTESDSTSQMPWGLFHVRSAGLDIFSTHLVAAPSKGRIRQRQVMEIDNIIQKSCPPNDELQTDGRPVGMPPILCGDFNAEPESDEIRFLRGFTTLENQSTFYQDAWAAAGDGSPGFTQDWRSNPMAADLNVHRKRIDYIFVGDPFRRAGSAGRILSASIVCDKPLVALHPSDHRGVVAEVEWPTRPPARQQGN